MSAHHHRLDLVHRGMVRDLAAATGDHPWLVEGAAFLAHYLPEARRCSRCSQEALDWRVDTIPPDGEGERPDAWVVQSECGSCGHTDRTESHDLATACELATMAGDHL